MTNSTPTLLALDASSTTIGWCVFDGAVRDHGTIYLKHSDAATYHLLRDRARLARMNGSNVVSGLVDSVVFLSLLAAFGGLPCRSWCWASGLRKWPAARCGAWCWSSDRLKERGSA